MNSIRNSITLIGNLGKDPESKKLNNGTIFSTFSIATNEVYKNTKGDKITDTQWHNCIAWGKTAEIIKDLLKKGKEVAVRGKLTYNNYEDKNGNRRYQPQIVVSEFVLLGPKSKS
jgi:single-strand DNA-binding protein